MKWVDRYNLGVDKDNLPNMVYSNIKEVRFCIHKVIGRGGNWYLTCGRLELDSVDLGTIDFDVAVDNSKIIVSEKFEILKNAVNEFLA